MTQDATMVGGLQRKQGLTGVSVASGTTLEITSGGALKVESGGSATVASGGTASVSGTLTIASGGTLTVATGGYLAGPYEAATSATTATALAASGLTTIAETSANNFNLAAPSAAGIIKVLTNIDHGATTVSLTVKATGCKILGGTTVVAGTSLITFLRNGAVTLVSVGTTSWAVAGVYASEAGSNITFT